MYLFVAVFGRRLRLVQPLQGAVVAFVKVPVFYDRNPATVHGVGRDFQSVDGAFQVGGEVVARFYVGLK